MATLEVIAEIPIACDIRYEETLSIRTVKDAEIVTLKNYFGFLMRSEVVIDALHKYCNECLKKKKIVRYVKFISNG